MTAPREGQGAVPARVYWVRRVTALAALVLIIVVAYFQITSPSGSGDDDKNPATNAPAPEKDSDESPAPEAAGDARACAAAANSITVTPEPFSVAAPAAPVFTVAIKNSSATPCLVDTSKDSSLVISSGPSDKRETYYSTVYCPADTTLEPRQYLLDSGVEESFKVTWNRKRVGENCVEGAAPGAGYYWVDLTIQGVAAAEAQFELKG